MCFSNAKSLSIVTPKSFCELMLLMTESLMFYGRRMIKLEPIKYFINYRFLLIYCSMGHIRKEWYHLHSFQHQNSYR